MGLPPRFVPGVLFAGRLWPDFDAWSVLPKREASKLWLEDVPLYIIHSTGDRIIPVEHARIFAKAHPDARVWILDDLQHVEAFAHPEYEKRLGDFLGGLDRG